jgi:hypothetical protein
MNSPSQRLVEVVFYSLMAVGLAVLCSLATAALGDRLLRRNKGRKTSCCSWSRSGGASAGWGNRLLV